MKMQSVIIEECTYELIRYGKYLVFPYFTTYADGLGSPICLVLYYLEDEDLEPLTTVTVNIPECKRSAGCQFIDINNNDDTVLDWLEENQFGERTGKTVDSGFCTYPEFDFYKGEKFHQYKEISESL